MKITLTEDHEDFLKEFLNISMGKAANKLAELVGLHVTLSIPQIMLASPQELSRQMNYESTFHYTQQSFFGELCGEVITLLNKDGGELLARDMCSVSEGDSIDESELKDCILDVSNILSGASLKGLCQQIEMNTRIQPPVIMQPSQTPLPLDRWEQSLVLQVSFLIEAVKFESETIICFADNGLVELLERLDSYLE